jgi:hypothetical protein
MRAVASRTFTGAPPLLPKPNEARVCACRLSAAADSESVLLPPSEVNATSKRAEAGLRQGCFFDLVRLGADAVFRSDGDSSGRQQSVTVGHTVRKQRVSIGQNDY